MTSPAGRRAEANRDGSSPLILAHRGFAPEGAENTLAAFRAAWELGCRWLETDVNTTRDGMVMVFHDTTVDRVTEGTGAIGEHTHAELSQLRVAGTDAPPTFGQLLAALPEARFNVDLKDEASVEGLPELLERAGAVDRVRIASFSEARRRRSLQRLRARGLSASTSSAGALGSGVFLLCQYAAPRLWPAVRRFSRRRIPGFDVVQLPLRLGWAVPRIGRVPVLGARLARVRIVGPTLIRRAHAAGVQVHVWTVDDPADMRALIDAGVDGIVTNRADLGLREAGRTRDRA